MKLKKVKWKLKLARFRDKLCEKVSEGEKVRAKGSVKVRWCNFDS